MNQPHVNEIERNKVRRAAAKLRENEDFALAMKLQEAEFEQHYDRNRLERRVVSSDTRISRVEQEAERRIALERHLQCVREQTTTDEALARQIQAQLEEENLRQFANLTHDDAALARKLSSEHDLGMGSNIISTTMTSPATAVVPVINATKVDNVPKPYNDDERLARELQERYLRRVSGARGTLDRRTQQELQFYIENQTLPHPSTLNLTSSRNSSQNFRPSMDSSRLFPPKNMILPPLPSYTEACTPTSMTPLTDSVLSRRTVFSVPITTNSINFPVSTPENQIEPEAKACPTLQSLSSLNSSLPKPSAKLLSQNIQSLMPASVTNQTKLNSSLINNSNHAISTVFHPTNPFLQDLMLSDYTTHNPDSPLAKNTPNNVFNDLRRFPEDTTSVLPGLSAEQPPSALSKNSTP